MSLFDELLEDIRNTPIEEIIQLRMDPVYRDQYLCPFHDDHTPNNFHINHRHNTFRCYACDVHGDGITFIQEYDHIGFQDTVYQIAYELGMINESSCKNGKRNKTKREVFVPVENPRADENTLDLVYRIFMKGNTLLGKKKLSDEHLDLLQNGRKLTMEQIEETGYFTFPSKYIMKPFLMQLAQNDLDDTILRTIPGFFYDSSRNCYSFSIPKCGAIGIPLRDEMQRVIGIQLRLDEKTNTSRYSWFSSAFAMGENKNLNNGMIYGSSPGAPIAVNFPKKVTCKTLFITEGHFKSQLIANTFGAISLSVQGVNNWSGITETLKSIRNDFPEIAHIYIAFDADMARKVTVIQPAIKMGLTLSEASLTETEWKAIHEVWSSGNKTMDTLAIHYEQTEKELEDKLKFVPLPIHYVLWDEKYGKGIDDMIQEGHKDKLRVVSLQQFWSASYQFLVSVEDIKTTIMELEDKEFRKISIDDETRNELFDEAFAGVF